ncbi:dATP/dGTP pyrophosphohydrolase domain-containing protein [Raoultella ornithinolytica]
MELVDSDELNIISGLVEVLEKAQQRIAELEESEKQLCAANVTLDARADLAERQLAAMDRDQVRNEHAKWSQATFGNVGPIGPLKHLSKEALEAAAEPADLSEWADMQFLLWDAQRRAGITDEQITQAMIEKLAVNKQREWPEPKDGEPRLHIKEQMAPVTQQEPIAWLNDAYLARGVVDGEAGSEDAGPGYIPVYREPATQPAPVVPPMQHWEELCRQYPDMSIRDAIIRAAWWNHCRAAMLAAAPQDEAKKDKPHNNFGTGARLTNHRFKV